ncbi:MAG: phosphotransferase [Desulfobacteraceae bacterium]|nr:phosphotransferase [Desulfobacteraceae bacterium]
MKALVLAAGFGTRLRPYSEHTPKPLFTIAGRPLLDLLIRSLVDAGCEAVAVNTHHLHHRIAEWIDRNPYPIPVICRHESAILGTGGAIANMADFWDERPFLVINADVVTDLDWAGIYREHRRHPHPATLVLHDCPEFNTVSVDDRGCIRGFGANDASGEGKPLAFTGIQVLDPLCLQFIPPAAFFSSIDMYRSMIRAGHCLKALVRSGHRWHDIGTPERYRDACLEAMIPEAFQRAFGEPVHLEDVKRKPLSGDGSDRSWWRLRYEDRSLILADHGIRTSLETSEADAFVSIGTHLRDRGLPVPALYRSDTFSGLVFLEDLGDRHLQEEALRLRDDTDALAALYDEVIRILIRMSVRAAEGFDDGWTWQTASYDIDLVMEKECRYFLEAFLNGYKGASVSFASLEADFRRLAEGAVQDGEMGFLHRDFQSRNVLMTAKGPHIIDFQGGRRGPLQYDLASLLIDPYADLPEPVQNALQQLALKELQRHRPTDPQRFHRGYRYCRLSRNLQILGAYAFLSRQKGKAWFEPYIPIAVRRLKHSLSAFEQGTFPALGRVVKNL